MKKLLVFDDSTDLLVALEEVLPHYDYELRTATNNKTFLKQLESFKPEIIIIDVLLNGKDGREICRSFRANPNNKEIALILFSASPKYLENFQECGADGIIEKPFGIKELIDKLEAAVQARKKLIS